MVFAHLVHSQLEPLLEFLCSLPGPTGKPALEFVMTEWMSRQHLFYGQYEGKVRSAHFSFQFVFPSLCVTNHQKYLSFSQNHERFKGQRRLQMLMSASCNPSQLCSSVQAAATRS